MILVTKNCYVAICLTVALLACLVVAVIILEIRLYIKIRRLKRIENLVRLKTIRIHLGLSRPVLDSTVAAFKNALQRHDLTSANDLLSQLAFRLRKVLR